MPRTTLLRHWVRELFAARVPRPRCTSNRPRPTPAFGVTFGSRCRIAARASSWTHRPTRKTVVPFSGSPRCFGRPALHVPRVLAEDLEQGLLLLSDLGSTTYLSALENRHRRALYRDANSALVALQVASRPGVLPEYDHALLSRELALFPSGIWRAISG
jgi:aminoglycoside/choline kinase family phosphotransferase